MNFRSALNRFSIVLGTACVLALQGCAIPQGTVFTTHAATEPDKANVYLYRVEKLNASGQSFDVQLNDEPAEKLLNASFLLMKIHAGQNLLKVKAGAVGRTYEHRWTAQAGQTYYLEFVLPHILLANAFNLGSDIVVREEVTARQDMRTLRGMK